MNRYIYVIFADESRQEAEPVLKELSSAGIQVMQGNIREEKMKKAGLALHLVTSASASSESYKKRSEMVRKLDLDGIRLHLSGDGKPADTELLLTAALEIFKSTYRRKEIAASALPEDGQQPASLPLNTAGISEPAATEEKDRTEDAMEVVEVQKEKAPPEINWEVGTIPSDTRAEMFREGMELLGGEEGSAVASAIELILKAANQGYAPAQYQLSICYDEGLGVSRSQQEAARWREMAAYGGIVKAQGEMGYCYEWGQGVPRNIREAVKWYQLASEQGDSQSKNNLAYCYQKGRGVTKDMVQALRLYTEAAQAGDPSAQYNLAYCYWYGEGTSINKERAIELFKQSMAGGNVKAAQMMRILGRYDYVSHE